VNDTRQYPERPIVGVGAVIVDEGRVVLIKRKYEPLKGHWSLPGGMVEIGETLESALSREMLEETGLRVDVGPVIEVFDRIMHDERKRVRYHFVLIDYLCWPAGGTLTPGSDVDAAIWVDPVELAQYDLTEKATSVIQRGLTLAREAPRPVR
jgi:8-oxo-dGTP diphosphatase